LTISERIIQLRNQRNISQYKLAKISGISQAGLSDLELGKKQPTVHTLEKIITALDLTWGEFFKETEAPELSPELRRLLDTARDLTPEQLETLQAFLNTMKGD